MKRIIVPLLLLCMGFASTMKAEDTDLSIYDNVIYMASGSVEAGTNATLSICMKNTASIRGFQFDLYLPEGVEVVNQSDGQIQASLNRNRLSSNDQHTLYSSEQNDGSIRFLCGSLENEYFMGNEGEMISLDLRVDRDMSAGDYSVYLRNIKLTETDIRKTYSALEVSSILSVTAESFISLGVGTLTDNFLGGTTEVEILQSEKENGRYRIVKPYSGIVSNGDDDYAGAELLEILVLDSNWTLGGIPITKKDLVFYEPINTGYHHEDSDADIWIYHPVYFINLDSEDYWLQNKVTTYQENGIPGQIQLAPYYYMDDIGGWNMTQEDGVIIITFPGYEEYQEDDMDTDISQLQNVVYVENVDAQAGEEFNLSISMKNTADIRGFQFYLHLPEGVEALKSTKGKYLATLTADRLPDEDEHVPLRFAV